MLIPGQHVKSQVKITDGSAITIDNNSLLEMESTNKGLLIPRVALIDYAQADPLTDPVPAGMLVYSKSGSVPDGFYFWNGNRWITMGITGAPVTKSVSGTLLKSETFVIASGDITLTLPVVTAADNGLSITVNNTGTHLHLVIISGNSGATIDGRTSSNLMRWQGNTYTAWNGNWLAKDKDPDDDILEVRPGGSFTSIQEAIAFLNIHMSGPALVKLFSGDYLINATQTINLPYPVTFQGLSYGETTIKAGAGVAGDVLFNCQSECYFKMVIFEAASNATGNDAIHFTGSNVYYEVKDAYFTGFNKGIVSTTNNDLWIFEVDIADCTEAGLEIAAGTDSGGQMRISETDFFHCGSGINLLSGISETISIVNCTFYNVISGSEIGIDYHPDSFTSFANIVISNNGWNNEGTFINGFDFSRSDGRDADALLVGNAGTEDMKPHCKINVTNNNLTTSLPNSGTFYKANWVNTSVHQSKWNVANNRMTYLSDNSSDGWAIISGSLSTNSTNRVITIAIVKNGVTATRYGETSLRVTTANQPFQFSTVIYIPDLSKNDFLELFVNSASSSDIVTFQDVYWFTNTQ